MQCYIGYYNLLWNIAITLVMRTMMKAMMIVVVRWYDITVNLPLMVGNMLDQQVFTAVYTGMSTKIKQENFSLSRQIYHLDPNTPYCPKFLSK